MQRLRWLYMFCLIPLLCLAVPTAISANPVIHLNQPANQQAGNTVTLSGSASLDDILIKVIRPDNTILYFDDIAVSADSFSTVFELPATTQPGAYTVVAGSGTDVDTRTFVVSAASDSDGETTNPWAGSENPSSPDTNAPKNGEISLPDQALQVTNETNSQGKAVTIALVDGDALSNAISNVAATEFANPIVNIEVEGTSGALKVELPAGVIVHAAETSPEVTINIQGDRTSYHLPVSLKAILSAIQSLDAKPEDAIITVQMNAVPDSLQEQMNIHAAQSNFKLLNTGIEFSIPVEANGTNVQVSDFGNTYVDRTVQVDGTINPANATAVMFDPQSGHFSFVPSIFTTTDGVTTVTIKRNGNSVYNVIDSTKTFEDITSHWAQATIELLAAKQVISGQTPNQFAPNKPITRAEFTALLVRALGISKVQENGTFVDVPADAWFAGSVNTAAKAKLVSGVGDGKFLPNEPLTREQMASLIANAMQATGTLSGDEGQEQDKILFADTDKISKWASDDVSLLVATEVIAGFPDHTFRPEEQASRAQAAITLKKMLEYVEFID